MGVGAVLVLLAAHLLARRDPLIRPVLVLDHLFAVAVGVALLALCAAIGQLALRRGRLEIDSAIETLAFSMAVGVGILTTAMLVFGTIGGLRAWTVGAFLLLAAAIVRHQLALVAGLAADAVRELRDKGGTVVMLLLGAAGLSMTILALAPTTDYDSLMYHLHIPKQYLEHGTIRLPDGNQLAAGVGAIHFLYLPLLAFGVPAGPGILHVLFTLSLGVVTLVVGTRLFSPVTGRVSAVLFWGSSIVLFVGSTPKIDVTYPFFLFLGHYALLRAHLAPKEKARWVVLAGLLLGVGLGIKHLAIAYIVALSPLVVFIAIRASKVTRERLRLIALPGITLVLAALPWLLKNWILFGGPFYPYFTAYVPPPWLAALYGTSGPPEGFFDATVDPVRHARERFNLRDWFRAPERLTPEADGWAYRANTAFALLVFAVFRRDRFFWWLLLPALAYVAIVVGSAPRLNLRYLIPAIPAFTVAVASIVTASLDRVRVRARTPLLIAISAWALAGPVAAMTRRLTETNAPAHATGVMLRRDYLSQSPYVEINYYARMVDLVNENVPRDGFVLLLLEARAFDLVPRVIQAHTSGWLLMAHALGPSRCLDGSGITHVLVNRGVMEWYYRRGVEPDLLQPDRLDDFVARCLELVEQHSNFSLYRVTSVPADGLSSTSRSRR